MKPVQNSYKIQVKNAAESRHTVNICIMPNNNAVDSNYTLFFSSPFSPVIPEIDLLG